MKINARLSQVPLAWAVAWGMAWSLRLAAAVADPDATACLPADRAPAKASIPWSQIAAKVGADYQGDGLALTPIAEGALLRCVFQRLAGEATPEGLWLTSTGTNGTSDRFRVVAVAVGRQCFTLGEEVVSLTSIPGIHPGPTYERMVSAEQKQQRTPAFQDLAECPGVTEPTPAFGERLSSAVLFDGVLNETGAVADTGTVSFEAQMVRFTRPGLVEEYSVSMDGVRQDFVVMERPSGAGELAVQLAVSGARIERVAAGLQLVLEKSGRRIGYSRLRATDATGKELSARIEVPARGRRSVVIRAQDGVELTDVAATGLAIFVNDAGAVYPLRIDPTFSDANWISMNPSIPGANNFVFAAVVDGSGNLYIGGQFTVIGDKVANHIAKWDGRNWSALGPGLDGDVDALAVSGSDLYAGGGFAAAGGSAAAGIAKWNGSTWSALGSGVDGQVYALATSSTNLYAGGIFTMAGGGAATNIAKWDGTNWKALGSGLGGPGGPFYWVSALAMSGSDLYAGGIFTASSAVKNIAKWDGSSWSALGSGVNGPVDALAVSGGDLYVGGDFTTAGGTATYAVAKWDGTSWTGLDGGLPGRVNALAVSGGDLYAGGIFTYAGLNYIARWDGSSWSGLGSGVDGIQPTVVNALAVSGSNVFAGGQFTTAGGSGADYIARWDGNSWASLGLVTNLGINGRVSALAVWGSGLYVAGDFSTTGGSVANYIAKWDGSSWSALGSGMDGPVNALVAWGSNLYAGGIFTIAGGGAANNIAKWDGTNWTALGSGVYGSVYVLALSGSDLYAGGSFIATTGSAVTNIAKWDGSGWSALGAGVTAPRGDPYYGGNVSALAVLGSNVYAAGFFTAAGGHAATNIAKWDGSRWSALGSGMNSWVSALAVSGNGVYAGGNFTMVGGSTGSYVAKWDGNSWSALGSGMDDWVTALGVSGTDLYAGGFFTMAGGNSANNIAKWDGTNWTTLGPGVHGPVWALAVSGSDLYAGGDFLVAGRKVSAYVAKAIVNPPVLAIEPDGSGGFFLRFEGVPGSDYRLQRAPSLSGPWATSTAQTAPANGQIEFWDIFSPPGQGFYRSVGP